MQRSTTPVTIQQVTAAPTAELIVAVATAQPITTPAAHEHVMPTPAGQHSRAATSLQAIPPGTTGDIDQRVPGRYCGHSIISAARMHDDLEREHRTAHLPLADLPADAGRLERRTATLAHDDPNVR